MAFDSSHLLFYTGKCFSGGCLDVSEGCVGAVLGLSWGCLDVSGRCPGGDWTCVGGVWGVSGHV